MEQDRESLAVQVAYDAWAATYDQDANATRDLDAVVLQRQGGVLECQRRPETAGKRPG
jgi:hypothetical protein